MSNFSDGVFEYGGAPVSGGRFSSPWATHYFVDGVDGNDAFDGKSPKSATKTFKGSLDKAGPGDVIYVRPLTYTVGLGFNRYTEDNTVTLAQKDLSIIGVCNTFRCDGSARLASSSTYALTVNGPGLHASNIGFFGESATGCVNMVDDANVVKAGGNFFTFYNCAFKGGYLAVTGGSDCARIYYNAFEGSTISSAYPCGIRLLTTVQYFRRMHIIGNTFSGRNGAAPATAYIKSSSAVDCITDMIIAENYFNVIPADTYYIDFSESSANEGQIANNHFAQASLDTDAEIKAGGLVVGTNYDTSGIATTD